MTISKTIKFVAAWVLLPVGLFLSVGLLAGCGDDHHHRVGYGRSGGYYPRYSRSYHDSPRCSPRFDHHSGGDFRRHR